MTSVSTGTMSESDTKVASKEAAALVRAFYESLARGRMVDALDLVATDAVLRDEAGNESRGIGAIARSSSERRNGHGATEARFQWIGVAFGPSALNGQREGAVRRTIGVAVIHHFRCLSGRDG